jgi:hypothetical protein
MGPGLRRDDGQRKDREGALNVDRAPIEAEAGDLEEVERGADTGADTDAAADAPLDDGQKEGSGEGAPNVNQAENPFRIPACKTRARSRTPPPLI